MPRVVAEESHLAADDSLVVGFDSAFAVFRLVQRTDLSGEQNANRQTRSAFWGLFFTKTERRILLKGLNSWSFVSLRVAHRVSFKSDLKLEDLKRSSLKILQRRLIWWLMFERFSTMRTHVPNRCSVVRRWGFGSIETSRLETIRIFEVY